MNGEVQGMTWGLSAVLLNRVNLEVIVVCPALCAHLLLVITPSVSAN